MNCSGLCTGKCVEDGTTQPLQTSTGVEMHIPRSTRSRYTRHLRMCGSYPTFVLPYTGSAQTDTFCIQFDRSTGFSIHWERTDRKTRFLGYQQDRLVITEGLKIGEDASYQIAKPAETPIAMLQRYQLILRSNYSVQSQNIISNTCKQWKSTVCGRWLSQVWTSHSRMEDSTICRTVQDVAAHLCVFLATNTPLVLDNMTRTKIMQRVQFCCKDELSSPLSSQVVERLFSPPMQWTAAQLSTLFNHYIGTAMGVQLFSQNDHRLHPFYSDFDVDVTGQAALQEIINTHRGFGPTVLCLHIECTLMSTTAKKGRRLPLNKEMFMPYAPDDRKASTTATVSSDSVPQQKASVNEKTVVYYDLVNDFDTGAPHIDACLWKVITYTHQCVEGTSKRRDVYRGTRRTHGCTLDDLYSDEQHGPRYREPAFITLGDDSVTDVARNTRRTLDALSLSDSTALK